MKKILTQIALIVFFCLSFNSCSKKTELQEIKTISAKTHQWYYFSDKGFEKIDLPQNAPEVFEKPWTEAIRITSASCAIPAESNDSPFWAYALVNKKGLLCFKENSIELFSDNSFFSTDTADSLVFSNGKPIFYLYQNTFFSEVTEKNYSIHSSRPFLVMFEPTSKIFYPLVSYENLKLEDDWQITNYFWDGTKWACSAKKNTNSSVEFSYFFWQPLIPLAELNPALDQQTFIFNTLSEESFKEMNMPKPFDKAPIELQDLLASLPQEFSFYVSWKDFSGTTPINFYKIGNSDIQLNAKACFSFPSKYIIASFSDGTTYIKNIYNNDIAVAFKLPLLPAGFSYGELVIAGDTLYVAWEESTFFKTARAGFISIDLKEILKSKVGDK